MPLGGCSDAEALLLLSERVPAGAGLAADRRQDGNLLMGARVAQTTPSLRPRLAAPVIPQHHRLSQTAAGPREESAAARQTLNKCRSPEPPAPSAHQACPCESARTPTCLLIKPQRVTNPSQLEAASSPLQH